MSGSGRTISRERRAVANRAFVVLCFAGTAVSLLVLVLLLGAIFYQGWRFLDSDFLTTFPSRRPANAGFKAAFWGSIWLCAVAAVASIPIGIATAIVLEEFKPRRRITRWFHSFVQLNIGNLAGVPSIVYGILGLTVFVRMFGLFGTGNLSSYDEMLRVHLENGQIVQGDVREETDEHIVLANPVRGLLTIPKADIHDEKVIYVQDHIFTLDDGRTVAGVLRNFDEGEITLATDTGEVLTFLAASVVNYDSRNQWQIADPDSPFYIRVPFGGSVLAGGLTLGLLILPVIIIASREALRAVPSSLREGAFALGATRWQMVRRMILPSAIPGIMTGSILAVSRAVGEAAPLLVVGGFLFITFVPNNLMSDFAAMPLQIFNWASRPQEEFHQVAASGIIVLLGVLFLFNALAIFIRYKFEKPLH